MIKKCGDREGENERNILIEGTIKEITRNLSLNYIRNQADTDPVGEFLLTNFHSTRRCCA